MCTTSCDKILVRWWDVPKRCVHQFSGTPGPQINRPWWHYIPALVLPWHFALYNTYMLMQNDRDISLQGHCVSVTNRLGDQGSQNIRMGAHRFWTSRHPTKILFEENLRQQQERVCSSCWNLICNHPLDYTCYLYTRKYCSAFVQPNSQVM